MVYSIRQLLLIAACGIVLAPTAGQCASRTRVASISVTVQVASSCQVSTAPAGVVRASDVHVACGDVSGYAVALEHGTLVAAASGEAGAVVSRDGMTATVTY